MNKIKIISNFFILLLILYNLTARARTKAELTITIKDCREERAIAYLSELKILKNGTEYKTLKPLHENKQELKNLEQGTYSIIYKTLFNKYEEIILNIKEIKKYSTTICTAYIDYSKETYKPIIDSLIEDEHYSIFLSSQGCFQSIEDTITIKRKGGNYTINWGDKTKKLTTKDIEAIRHFEIELNYMNDGYCTTTDTYILEFRGIKKQIEDGSCRWNGDKFLKKIIFKEM